MDDSEILIIGANGQLGQALKNKYPSAQAIDVSHLDISDAKAVKEFDWSRVKIIINAAAYTDVDGAETPEGRLAAWKVNSSGTANLAEIASAKNLILVHVSTDYVFDGSQNPHGEDEAFSPLNVYGASKAAGDIAVSLTPKHYLLRTSFVIGEGKNFVRIMLELGNKGVDPSVIADQLGRLTFASELVRAIDHLLISSPPFGSYNVTNSGEPTSWADLSREIFKLAGFKNSVSDTTTAEYYKDRPEAAARPLNSVLDLSKIHATGFKSTDWREDLANYIKRELAK